MKKRKWIDNHMLKAFRAARPRLLSAWPKLKEKGWTKKIYFKLARLSTLMEIGVLCGQACGLSQE